MSLVATLRDYGARWLRNSPTPLLPNWWSFALVVVAALLLLGFSAPIVVSLHPVWQSDYYSHGYIVLILTFVFCVMELKRSPLSPLTPAWSGLIALVLVSLISLAGLASTSQVVVQSSLPLLWITGVWAIAGAHYARRLLLPLAYLFVALPTWDFVIEPTRRLTIIVVSEWIHAAGLPAFIEGNLIHVPTGTFEVAGGCGGLKYILVSLALACGISLYQYRRWTPVIVLISSALVLAFLSNWLRIFISVAAGLSPENAIAAFVQERHLVFGWGLFVVAILIPILLIDRVVQSRYVEAPAREASPELLSLGPHSQGVAIATCAVLAVSILLGHRVDDRGVPTPATPVDIPLPEELGAWAHAGAWEDSSSPVFVGAGVQAAGWYTNGMVRVGVFIAHYANQTQDHEVVNVLNRPEGHAGTVMSRRVASVSLAQGYPVRFEELELADLDGETRLVWTALRVAGRPTVGDLPAKILQIVGVSHGRRDAQVLVFSVRCDDGCSAAESWLSQFAAVAAEPLLERAERSLADEGSIVR